MIVKKFQNKIICKIIHFHYKNLCLNTHPNCITSFNYFKLLYSTFSICEFTICINYIKLLLSLSMDGTYVIKRKFPVRVSTLTYLWCILWFIEALYSRFHPQRTRVNTTRHGKRVSFMNEFINHISAVLQFWIC